MRFIILPILFELSSYWNGIYGYKIYYLLLTFLDWTTPSNHRFILACYDLFTLAWVEWKEAGKYIILMQLAASSAEAPSKGTECFSCGACSTDFKIIGYGVYFPKFCEATAYNQWKQAIMSTSDFMRHCIVMLWYSWKLLYVVFPFGISKMYEH